MCGRFTITDPRSLLDEFELGELPAELEPRYNVAPSQEVPAIVAGREGRRLVMMRWGLVPSWADDLKIGNRLINARSETAADKPAFREAFARRHCLVAADGFFEWRREGRRRVPFYIRRKDGRPMAFAGLWERWRSPDGADLRSCTILTTAANELVAPLHDRMPVVIERDDYGRWLDPAASQDPALLAPAPADELEAFEVSDEVNSPKNDRPEILRPGARQQSLF